MSNSRTIHDLEAISIEVIRQSMDFIRSNYNLDLAVSRLESLLDAMWATNELMEIPWIQPVSELVQNAVDFLTEYLEVDTTSTTVGRGRPKIPISASKIESLLGMRFRVPVIAAMFGVSKETIFRRMRDAGISVGATYTQISDANLDNIISSILMTHPNTGYKRMKGYLHVRGIRVTDLRIRLSLRNVDPEGVYQRTLQNRAIVRRQHYVNFSNEMWHLDTNMKLVRWGIIVRSCIDGKSRTAVYAHASADNRADTNFLAFLGAVERYGVPLRTRSDKGGENVLIARYMIQTRGTGRGSHIAGRSVHNQRIERFWKDVFYGVLSFYYCVVSKLEDDNVLNIEDSMHMTILHQIFIPRLCQHLNTFREAWNVHPISTEHNFTPQQLMLMHLPPPEFDMSLTEDDLRSLHFLCNDLQNLDLFEEEDSITTPFIAETDLPPPVVQFIRSLDFTQYLDSYGYGAFVRAVSLIP